MQSTNTLEDQLTKYKQAIVQLIECSKPPKPKLHRTTSKISKLEALVRKKFDDQVIVVESDGKRIINTMMTL